MSILCKPPEPLSFTGNVAHNWREFAEQLQWFLEGTESTEKGDKVKIGIMLSYAGKEAREIYKTLPWTADGDANKFDKVCEAFQNHCSPRKNIIYERYTFWSLQQDEGEPINTYLTRLKVKIDTCEYNKEGWPASVRQELIRDKFVFGLTDDSLKERLLRETPLTLSKAIEIAQRSEASKQQIKDMKSSSRPNVDAVKGCRGPIPTYCGQCGQTHKPKECPAYGLKCSICKKLHHFAKVCRNKKSLSRQKHSTRPPKTPHKRDRDSRTDINSRRNVHESQETDHSNPSDPTSNNDSDSLQSSDEFTISPLQIEGIKKSSAWLTDVLINSDHDKLWTLEQK